MEREELMVGYGKSSKPPGSSTHIEYSKRELANDLVQLMSHFKFEKFNILAHDRGARVAHRLALDHPGSVEKVVLLDIAPTLWMYEQTDMAFVRSLISTILSNPVIIFLFLFGSSRFIRDGMIDEASSTHPPISHQPHHLSLTRPRQLTTRQQVTGTGSS
jgi:pimeloyl-ACP methyl ester carboxylesterase